jgi:hypothetical protein
MATRVKSTSRPKKTDPVLADQGGRSMPGDPRHVAHLPLEEAIRVRAYQLYEERGRADGQALTDWLDAEAQINGSHESQR